MVRRYIYEKRLIAKRVLAAVNHFLPKAWARRLRSIAEVLAFRFTPDYQGDTLPPIFHYWSERNVRPLLTKYGVQSPEHFYLVKILEEARRTGGFVRILSLGAGACSLEISLAKGLLDSGVKADFECIDLNASLIAAARKAAEEAGLSNFMRFTVADLNGGLSGRSVDVVIVNQFFHHVEDLETMAAHIRRAIFPLGVLLTSDVVGRNGHLLWPSVDTIVQHYWTELPLELRVDRFTNEPLSKYVSEDHAAYSNEGIRAQDVVSVLKSELDFEVFLTYAGAIIPFVERRIGFNFDVECKAHTNFIDHVAERDALAIQMGSYPPSNLVGALRVKGSVANCIFDPISPDAYLESLAHEMELI